jgi:inorganic triphosphatase YgiF
METELKLSLRQQDVPALLAHPLLAAPAKVQRLLNTYFDTPAFDLKQRRMAVRERLAGNQWLLTVKTAGNSENGLSRRQEWEASTTPGALDFAALVDDAELAAALMALRANLKPLFRSDFERHSWVLMHDSASIEVAIDQGHITVPGTALSEGILELELELLSGPETALHALAEALRHTSSGVIALTPLDASKAQRGLALFAQSNPS